MAHQEGQQNDHMADGWLSAFEEECLEDLESSETNMEDNVQRDTDFAMQKLFLQFQNSATAIAQLYKDRTNGLSLWIPFQNAASSVTTLYKDSVDTAKHCMESGVQRGRQRQLKDIVSWVKKRRRHIRREDLLAFLSGKNPPQRTKMSGSVVRHSASARMDRSFPRFPSGDSLPRSTEADLQCFREAIALQGLDGAMSNISVGFRPHNNSNSNSLSGLPKTNVEELNSFILDEFSRNCDSRKRAATPDVNMDSPTRKKNRLL
ncbi:HUWE1-associated protein modifying stress responses-like [Ruditapes philippinarum]|uniref:HUWE1-associated protein modifying stress responses-like n=1 Tax=Ruditapes philippinarum TaxID=129788 RepID=UPI00295B651A|nr:HUWE1-associated protein modifying stress responses-like [Ruditapes philippinarum]